MSISSISYNAYGGSANKDSTNATTLLCSTGLAAVAARYFLGTSWKTGIFGASGTIFTLDGLTALVIDRSVRNRCDPPLPSLSDGFIKEFEQLMSLGIIISIGAKLTGIKWTTSFLTGYTAIGLSLYTEQHRRLKLSSWSFHWEVKEQQQRFRALCDRAKQQVDDGEELTKIIPEGNRKDAFLSLLSTVKEARIQAVSAFLTNVREYDGLIAPLDAACQNISPELDLLRNEYQGPWIDRATQKFRDAVKHLEESKIQANQALECARSWMKNDWRYQELTYEIARIDKLRTQYSTNAEGMSWNMLTSRIEVLEEARKQLEGLALPLPDVSKERQSLYLMLAWEANPDNQASLAWWKKELAQQRFSDTSEVPEAINYCNTVLSDLQESAASRRDGLLQESEIVSYALDCILAHLLLLDRLKDPGFLEGSFRPQWLDPDFDRAGLNGFDPVDCGFNWISWLGNRPEMQDDESLEVTPCPEELFWCLKQVALKDPKHLQADLWKRTTQQWTSQSKGNRYQELHRWFIRKYSLHYHPDKNPEPTATEKYQMVKEWVSQLKKQLPAPAQHSTLDDVERKEESLDSID